MHKSAIKTFATEARLQLRKQITLRATEFGLTAKALTPPDQATADTLIIGDKVYGSEEAVGYARMVERFETLKKQQRTHKAAFEMLIDEAAYSWFNRLCALRLMEVQGFLPRRVLSGPEATGDPEILKEALRLATDGELPGIDPDTVDKLRYSDDAALYRKLLVAQCNALKSDYPFLFETISEELALLLPLNLLSNASVVHKLVSQIPEADWQEVEIIGWLYQYYIADRKDKVIGAKSKVATVDIPAATQLFTPAWIVQYMVQNSLGRLWLEHHPESKLREHMPYYLDSPPQSEAVQLKIETAQHERGTLRLEEIKVIDPACGSGHILVYAFDLLFEMYREQGYRDRDIAPLILEHNLTGLDLDGRAVQLASFALLMKARQKLRRLKGLQPHVLLVQSSKGIELDGATQLNVISEAEAKPWQELVDAFQDADALGSLITPPALDYAALRTQLSQMKDSMVHGLAEQLAPILAQADALRTQYDVVVANPPYMGNKGLNNILKTFFKENYKDYKSDAFAVSVVRYIEFTKENGYLGLMTPFVWMFIKSYEKFRQYLYNNTSIDTLVKPSYTSFFESAIVPVVTFTLQKSVANKNGIYFDLGYLGSAEEQPVKLKNGISDGKCDYKHLASALDFAKIPGAPVAYWVSERVREIFEEGTPLSEVAEPKVGLQTGSNDRFLRLWYEVHQSQIGFKMESRVEAQVSQKKWFPYNKGGEYRKWYGNQEYIVNWFNDGFEIRNFTDEKGKVKSRPQNTRSFFMRSASWSKISAGALSLRYYPKGFIFDVAGTSLFAEKGLSAILGMMNSRLSEPLIANLSPTMNYEVGQIANTSILNSDNFTSSNFTDNLISLSKTDWDAFETSWDFEVHPMVRYAQQAEADTTVQATFDQWQTEAEERFRELQRLEIENNRFWIEAYGLQEELDPDVPDEQVTVNRADLERDVVSLLSYAVGCLMGRYSLDQKGLVHAGQAFDPALHTTFAADADAIVPVHDVGWFEDDLVLQLMAWFKTVFGDTHYAENLRFVAETLGTRKGETPEETLRRYFLSGFMKDHHKTYKKRPIYWFFTSGKQRAFNAYMYLHRYDKDTLARLRSDYLHPLQLKLQAEYERLQSDGSNARRVKQLQDQLKELQAYDEVLKHKADQRIELDLDDGVAYNYTLFDGLVYEGSDLKMKDLLKKSQWKRDLLAEAEKAKV